MGKIKDAVSAAVSAVEKRAAIANVARGARAVDDSGAGLLMTLDATIQSWTKQIDAKAEAALKKLPAREQSEIATACELTSSALPVATALKAVHYGALRIAFRVLPRMAEKFLMKEFDDLAGKVAVRVAAKKMAGFVPLLGSALSATVGIYDATKFYNEMEAEIHAVLGCEKNKLEKKPMRWAVNDMVSQVKKRVSKETFVKKKVHTRRKSNGHQTAGDQSSGGNF